METKDFMFERHKILKHQRRLYLMFGIILVCIIFSLFSNTPIRIGKKQDTTEDAGYIARIRISGEIFTNQEISNNIAAMAENDSIKAVIVHINSGGGTVTGSEIMFSSLSNVSKVKPVVSVVEDVAASGAYMLALASDCIFAKNTSVIGSIGVFSNYAEVTTLVDKLGINVGVVKSAPLKAGLNPFEKATEEMIESRQNLINDMFYFFKGLVQERRNMTAVEIARVSDARAFTGRQAIALNLIDAIGDEKDAHNWLIEVKGIADDLTILDHELFERPKKSFLESIGLLYEKATNFLSSKTSHVNNLPKLEAQL